MICQECNMRPVALHFTKVINGEKTEVHLCERCAQNGQYASFFTIANNSFSFHNLLSGVLNAEQHVSGKQQHSFVKQDELQCPKCGMLYGQFLKSGRFGCAHCYEAFQMQLDPIVKRLHSGNTVHHGKIPKRAGGNIHLRKELGELKEKLQHYIHHEEFEKAAETRDAIRTIEQQLNGHRKEE